MRASLTYFFAVGAVTGFGLTACGVPLEKGEPLAIQPTAALSGHYQLAFNDEFEGDYIDRSKWAMRLDKKHRSVQLAENLEVASGVLTLKLTLLDQPLSKKMVASGAGIVSLQRFKYGYYEVKAKLGDGVDDDNDGAVDEGWHHAFWLMAADVSAEGEVATTYPPSRRTELDVFENPSENINEFQQHIIVWKPDGEEWGRLPKPPSDLVEPEKFSAHDWHTYGAEFTPDSVTFYIDGKVTKSTPYPVDEFTHDELNIWVTAISANWNNADPEPSMAVYDYVRFFTIVENP